LFTCLIIASIGVTAVFHQLQERDRKIIRRQETEITRLAKLAERERIARDLHDLLGHTLSLIALKAELAHRLIPADTARAASEMADVAKVARGALAEVRQAIVGLHAVGLIDALKKAEETLYAAGLKIAVDITPLPTLAEDLEHAIAQTLTEAVTNIVRHAAAKRVVITLSHAAEELKLSIADDGRGMGDSRPGNGMTGMRARVAALGGSIAWRNEGGSTVELCVPLAAS
jgi:two-component system sensor histidine kinase DesK